MSVLTEYDEQATLEILKEEAREEGREEGRKEGREEGRKEGIILGIIEALEEGSKEGLGKEGKVEVLNSLIKSGTITTEDASSVLGISTEEFETLVNQQK